MIDTGLTGTHVYVRDASSKSFMISWQFLVSFSRNIDRTSMPLTSIPSWINHLIASINFSLELFQHNKWSALFPFWSFLFTSTPCRINVSNFLFWFIQGRSIEEAGCLILHSSNSSFSFSASYVEIKKK